MKKNKSALLLIICLLAMMLSACSVSGSEAAVRSELESMRSMQLDQEMTEEITGMLDEEGREDFGEFLEKAGDFDFDIQKSEASESGDGSEVVTVRITTYCFGREYLRTWNDYLEKEGDKAFDAAEFYSMLMENLSDVEDKTYSRIVEVNCTEKDGAWSTDISGSRELRDALLGGMLNEIASLAGY